jgi:hypothetical protein
MLPRAAAMHAPMLKAARGARSVAAQRSEAACTATTVRAHHVPPSPVISPAPPPSAEAVVHCLLRMRAPRRRPTASPSALQDRAGSPSTSLNLSHLRPHATPGLSSLCNSDFAPPCIARPPFEPTSHASASRTSPRCLLVPCAHGFHAILILIEHCCSSWYCHA